MLAGKLHMRFRQRFNSRRLCDEKKLSRWIYFIKLILNYAINLFINSRLTVVFFLETYMSSSETEFHGSRTTSKLDCGTSWNTWWPLRYFPVLSGHVKPIEWFEDPLMSIMVDDCLVMVPLGSLVSWVVGCSTVAFWLSLPLSL